MSDDRPKIPNRLKIRVRQRCRFGCVNCRCPIYDYHHIIEYSEVRVHEYENLVLLCPTCHRKATNGLIDEETIREKREEVELNPSRTKSESFKKSNYTLLVGNNIIKAISGYIFDIEGLGYIKLGLKKRLSIDAKIFDRDGSVALEIEDNEYTFSSDVWDIEYIANRIRFRDADGVEFAKLILDVANGVITFEGRLRINERSFLTITEAGGIQYRNILLATHNIIENCSSAISVGSARPRGSAGIVNAIYVGVNGGNYGGRFSNVLGAGVLNSTNCLSNEFTRCSNAFQWTSEFFDTVDRLCESETPA